MPSAESRLPLALLALVGFALAASALAPYRYVRLVFALILAFIVFDERPDTPTMLGAGVIVASGCYMMWRETVLRRRPSKGAGLAPAE